MPCTVEAFTPVDKSIPVPFYYQLKSQLIEFIKAGRLVEGDMIPAENDFADHLSISRPTVRQALSELVSEGYLERKKGRGTFVSSPKIDAKFLRRLKTFNEEMTEKGLTPSTALVGLSRIKGRPEINRELGIDETEELIELRRVRSANKEPILYQETYLPYQQFSKLLQVDFTAHTLYSSIMELYGVHVYRVNREIEAANVSAAVAKLLDIKAGDAVSLVRTISYDDEGKTVEYSISRYRGNRVKFSVELYR